jgi:hypothetical protein
MGRFKEEIRNPNQTEKEKKKKEGKKRRGKRYAVKEAAATRTGVTYQMTTVVALRYTATNKDLSSSFLTPLTLSAKLPSQAKNLIKRTPLSTYKQVRKRKKTKKIASFIKRMRLSLFFSKIFWLAADLRASMYP